MANELYAAGEEHARALIQSGDVDETSAWSISAAEEDELLGSPPDWTKYASWHLGQDQAATKDTKARWRYPFGKMTGGKAELYRSALRAIASRASQQGDDTISTAASDLLDDLDAKKAPAARATARHWYRFLAQADPAVAELLIYDEIGSGFWSEGVTAKQFVTDLQALPEAVKTIRVRVNSPGGNVFDAIAIANALRAQSRDKQRVVEMTVEGLAASAATIVTSAGDTIRISDNALMMIHNPIGLVWGPADEMRKTAGVLDQVRDAIVATYRWVSPLSVEAISELMDQTFWMSAEEAVANGFATEIVQGVKATASLRPEALRPLGEIPERHRARLEPLLKRVSHPRTPRTPAPRIAADARDILRECAGFPELAEELVGAGATLEDVRARLQQAKEIRGLCATAKFPELAEGYIAAKAPAAVVRAHLTTLGAKFDRIEIDAHLQPDAGAARPGPRINVVEIYRTLNTRPALKGA
ncbi:MAG TPA: head maturation protease, ClpP-related [Methylomirabilota bacterium]|jgi:ATP-dependent protease ClpP protease subunit|nr:head maturation protease, ClpP-related [Methylomirabilota bacterium]